MQRVAIARALVNNPDILLADEPTGALDSETSVQIMELIKEIAGERLVIMVTHNPELAYQYASRIVRLKDGLVESDSNPYAGGGNDLTDAEIAPSDGQPTAEQSSQPSEVAAAESGSGRGEEKKEYVMTKANRYAIENGIAFDETAVSDKVEELIALSKEVNAKDTTKTDEVAAVSGSAEAAAGRDVITIPAKK